MESSKKVNEECDIKENSNQNQKQTKELVSSSNKKKSSKSQAVYKILQSILRFIKEMLSIVDLPRNEQIDKFLTKKILQTKEEYQKYKSLDKNGYKRLCRCSKMIKNGLMKFCLERNSQIAFPSLFIKIILLCEELNFTCRVSNILYDLLNSLPKKLKRAALKKEMKTDRAIIAKEDFLIELKRLGWKHWHQITPREICSFTKSFKISKIEEEKHKKLVKEKIDFFFKEKKYDIACQYILGFDLENEFPMKDIIPKINNLGTLNFVKKKIRKNKKGKIDNEDKETDENSFFNFLKFVVRDFGWEKGEEFVREKPLKFKLMFIDIMKKTDIKNYDILCCLRWMLSTNSYSNPTIDKFIQAAGVKKIELWKEKKISNFLQERDYFGPISIFHKENKFYINENIKSTENLKERNFLKLEDLSYYEENIIFLQKKPSQKEELTKAIDNILNTKEIGMDCEFAFNSNFHIENQICKEKNKNTASLLQIAIPGSIYIFDVLDLFNSQLFLNFYKKLLESKIVKICYSWDSDRAVLSQTLSISPLENNFLDLSLYFSGPGASQPVSLSKVVKLKLDKQLCKFNQVSCWSRRPLRKAQIHYAALDAAVCLKLGRIVKNEKIEPRKSFTSEEKVLIDNKELLEVYLNKKKFGVMFDGMETLANRCKELMPELDVVVASKGTCQDRLDQCEAENRILLSNDRNFKALDKKVPWIQMKIKSGEVQARTLTSLLRMSIAIEEFS